MKQAKDCIIFPLDVPTGDEAKRYVELLSGHVGMFKVGLELFIRSGPEIIEFIHSTGGARVFLDLKLHDIPETVRRAMGSVSELGVAFATVHCGEAVDMLEAAVAGSQGRVRVLGVTVLTSVSPEDIGDAGFRKEFYTDLSGLVLKRAADAKRAGCAGVVCSGEEVRLIKDNLGKDFLAVTPGIRPARKDASLSGSEDQKRVATPAGAVRSGSDYLVIGRPIRDAADPIAATNRIAEEIETVLGPSPGPEM